jgi:hypothetical protein
MNTRGATILQRLPGGGAVQRIAPLLPATAMKTFEVRMPLSTHFRPASCQESDCNHWRDGWVTGFSDVDLPHKWEAAQTYGGIAHRRGLRFTVQRVGNTVTFTFPPGQQCIEGHRVAIDRPPLYIARDGDWRGNPRKVSRLHANAQDFREDWLTTEDRFRTLQKRG